MGRHGKETPKVLVVDDDREMRDLLAEIALYIGCQPVKARSANKALSVVETEKIDLMLLDIYMPGGNGVDMLSTVKRRGLQIPTLVVSGYVSTAVLRQLVGLGVKGVVAKPFDVDRLMEDMERALGVGQDGDEPERRCAFCGNAVSGGHKYCKHCGQPLGILRTRNARCVHA
jgi:DNA-binding NtrC family response regulator